MLLIRCPVCGIRADETEFRYGEELGAGKTGAREAWLCLRGCGSWFALTRDRASQRIATAARLQQTAVSGAKGSA